MCVICVKPAGVKMPPDTRLEDMFRSNSDGAGFMYVRNGKVVIRKGFMKIKHFKRGLAQEQINDSELVVMHFRIATAGSVSSKNTHPFPLSSDVKELRALRLETDVAMAHNGILSYAADTKADLSDTMTFVRDILSDGAVRTGIFNPSVKDLLGMSIGSNKMVFINKEGQYSLVGTWLEDALSKDGCFYSNLIFRGRYTYSFKDDDDEETYWGREGWKHQYFREYGRWPSETYDNAHERALEKHELEKDKQSTVLGSEDTTKKDGFADQQEKALVVVDYDAKNCPHCGYSIASHIQLCCSKCGKIFYRDHEGIGEVYAH